MQSVNIIVSSEIDETPRVKQIGAMFDVPINTKLEQKWEAQLPIDEKDWSIGLIVGPSGCGKTLIAEDLFGKEKLNREIQWKTKSIVDDFKKDMSIKDITDVFSSVGFNTIPSWMKPFRVLSNGEKFRVDLARRMIEEESLIVVDEFTSVVDRQVAKSASHAVQKYIRRSKEKKHFVAVSCHFDIIDWLQPDWVFQPSNCEFKWRRLRRRPETQCRIQRVEYKAWKLFAKYHYMSSSLHKAARCFGLFIDDNIVSFLAVLPRPISRGKNHQPIIGASRAVTLPDFQGMGLAHILNEYMASAFKAIGKRYRRYPAHPVYIRQIGRQKNFVLIKKPSFLARSSLSATSKCGGFGGRPNAVFEYVGPAMEDRIQAARLINGG